MTVVLVPVESPYEAEIMRGIRNTCGLYMTGSQAEITVDQQQAWFTVHRDDPLLRMFLLRDPTQPIADAFGFGLIRQRQGGQWVVSGGLRPSCRRLGLGTVLFSELTARVHGLGEPAWLDVFEDNMPARNLYDRLGYEVVSASVDGVPGARTILTMRKDPTGP